MARTKVTQQDLEKVMNVDDWLTTTDRVRKSKNLQDAWAHGDTDCAFRINNITGIQRSRNANDWNYWGDMSQIQDDKGDDFGTYLNFKLEKKRVEIIFDQMPQVTAERSKVYNNTSIGSSDINYEYTETESTTVRKDVEISNRVSMTMEAGVEVGGFSVKISSTSEQTKATVDSTTRTVEKSDKVWGTVAAGKYLEVHTVKSVGEKRYRVKIPVVMEGWVGLCSANDQGTFVPYPLYDFVDEKRLTRWITFDMFVESTSYMVKTYTEPTNLSVSEEAVKKEFLSA
ncbi:hypothetical protein KFL_007490010 [Klebsormidium nitens]|uniref:Uncharacterized protein n=1 Tax=Klebsormidium nitens TaxID=105231 RepID=A0A1Y1IM76_KLENI|nr:hypothetical protein KFL_007490010 [Klebsormidium nitens]|eukprot:GAQ91232.1 hypothetical protein KFL_007490010 [Klebsormidium nitens]